MQISLAWTLAHRFLSCPLRAAALRFQPTKRPQLSSQKPKTKLPSQRPLVDSSSATSSHERTPNLEADPQRASARTTLLDWTNDAGEDDVNGFYAPEKRQRGGRKKRKKNRDETHLPRNWDDIYDPSRPNVYEEYKASDEKYLEIREWKDKLYAHRFSRRRSSDSDSDSPPRHSAFKRMRLQVSPILKRLMCNSSVRSASIARRRQIPANAAWCCRNWLQRFRR